MNTREVHHLGRGTTNGRRLVMLAVLVASVAFFAGMLIGRTSESEKKTESPGPTARTAIGPTGEQDGVPIGYANNEDGAVSAAANFTLAQSVCADDLEECLSVMRTIAAPEWQQEAEQQARNGLEFTSERFGEDATVTTSLLRYRVKSFSLDHASIEFWAVTVLEGPKMPDGESVWGTLQIGLVWTGTDWRVTGQQTSPGPSPRSLDSGEGTNSLQSVIDAFEQF